MAIAPGSRIGPYDITELIGEGGMGKVWRAHHTALKRDDALKVLPDGSSRQTDDPQSGIRIGGETVNLRDPDGFFVQISSKDGR